MKKYILLVLIYILSINLSYGQQVTIYSGNCTLYKITYIGNYKKNYSPIKTAFGKVVINRTAKKFNFFFDGKLVYSSQYEGRINANEGGEYYSMDVIWSASRLSAEKFFEIIKSSPFSRPANQKNDLGYIYEIENYKIN